MPGGAENRARRASLLRTVRRMDIDIDAWFAVLAAARAHDRPGGPAPERAAEAGRLRVPSLHCRAVPVTLPAPDGAPGYAGVALLRLHDTEENAANAFLDTLTVHPAHRGRGVGRALWDAVRARLAAEGRSSVNALVERGGAGERFAVGRGAECALPMVEYVQEVAAASAPNAPAPAVPAPPMRLSLRRLERCRPRRPCRRARPRPRRHAGRPGRMTWTNSTTPGTRSGYGPRPASSWTVAGCC